MQLPFPHNVLHNQVNSSLVRLVPPHTQQSCRESPACLGPSLCPAALSVAHSFGHTLQFVLLQVKVRERVSYTDTQRQGTAMP